MDTNINANTNTNANANANTNTNMDFLGERYAERPIILSPSPVEPSFTNASGMPQNYQAQRNQSVGFNLQQEFEALKADLDLDLSYSNEAVAASKSILESADQNPESGAGVLASAAQNESSVSQNGHSVSSSGSVVSPPPSSSGASASRVLSGGPSLLASAASSPYGLTGQGSLNSHSQLSAHMGSHSTMPETLMRDPSGAPSHAGAGLQSLLMHKNPGFASSLGSLPSRPQSVNDFSSILPRSSGQPFSRAPPSQPGNFYSEMMAHTSWIETLNPQEIKAMLDYWCTSLPFDILLTMKSRLHSHLSSGISSGMQAPPVFGNKVDNNYSQYNGDFVADMDALSFNDSGRPVGTHNQPASLLQPQPKANSKFHNHLFADSKVQRPKSADPSLHNRMAHGSPHVHPGDRARSPTSHLYEKTNFLQLAAASHSPHSYAHAQQHQQHQQHQNQQQHLQQPRSQHLSGSPDEGFDQSAAHKLGALATINSRVALDFNRKGFQQSGANRGHSAAAFEESLNRSSNSSSVPASTQKYSVAAMSGASGSTKGPKKEPELATKPKISSPSTPVSNSSSMPTEIVNQELLNNIPAWLKLLRLHKYTDYLKDIYWKDLVELTDEDLEDKGVKALGARRKLLKAFETVKISKGIDL